MIDLDKIEYRKDTISDELYDTYYAKLEFNTMYRIVKNNSDIPEEFIKEHMQNQIIHGIYGELRPVFYELLYIAKSIKPDPSYPVDHYRKIQELEQKIKGYMG